MKTIKHFWILSLLAVVMSCNNSNTTDSQNTKLKALIIDGQNNHYIWPKTTLMMRDYLEQTGLFEVSIHRTDQVWLGIKYNAERPGSLEKYYLDYPVDTISRSVSPEPIDTLDIDIDFSKYDVIVSNLGAFAAAWPDKTKNKFENYMKEGGGLVIVHAANNAWGDWDEYNRMIGLGAWGDRDSTTGPYAFYNDKSELELKHTAGIAGSHGAEHEYHITTREPEHPIMKDLPLNWLHTKDELYDRMRGPFVNATILATAYADVEVNEQPWEPKVKGSGWHVPMLMTINYGKGRIFHAVMGHFDYSMECVGYTTTLQRGTEWAATGIVSQELPEDFPTKEKTSARKWSNKN